MSDELNSLPLDSIAIVGMAGRFPGAATVDEFWQNLRDGVESISFFTEEELEEAGLDSDMIRHPNYVKSHGAIEDVEFFDAAFFGIPPREAEITDPQHRLFLECAWQALENAGYDAARYDGSIGVFGGVGVDTYALFNLFTNDDAMSMVSVLQASIRNRTDHLTTQTAYKLNLRGPSVTVQTACSTSLVAVHLACQSLLNGESDMVLAGGVSISVPQKHGYMYQEGGILSPDGHCRSFDAQAQGTVGSSGAGIVVLKRLDDAVVDRDTIYAVIRGSAINNDGAVKVGYTAPSVDGQADVIAEALAVADVDPESIGYIETHGTGTTLGDPMEIEALTRVFRASTEKKRFCAIGAVKSNVGHLDTAAGVTGLIKTALTLKHKQIPESLHYEKPNPLIDFENSPFYVNNKLTDWLSPSNGTYVPRRAGVSSFGMGGTNAHLIVEEAPEFESDERRRPWHMLMLSARTSTGLEQATENLAAYLADHPELNLADVAYTLQVGRHEFGHRRIIICNDGSAVEALEALDPSLSRSKFQVLRENSG
ncbi:polyketide synthase [Chloroflexi bacterium TSY]|nr:polyketide synthase [Chloroflexi bacterium TSY]